MTPEDRMGDRIIDVEEWAAVVLIAEDGSAAVRGDGCPHDVARILRLLANDVEQRHAGHQCALPVREPGAIVWRDGDGRVWRSAGLSDVTPVMLYQPDGGGDLMPLSLVRDMYGPITPIGGDVR